MDKRLFLAAAGCVFSFHAALGDTRDDVLAGIQRCQTIQDDRAWLDCTYGAQQPMRAKLGLAPAPAFQQHLVPPVVFAPATDARPAAVDARPAKVSSPAPLPRRKASFFQILTGSAQPVAVSPLAAVQYDSAGAFSATLQNGQVWRQVDPDAGQNVRLKVGAKVSITPGALGSYNLQADGTVHVFKVELKK